MYLIVQLSLRIHTKYYRLIFKYMNVLQYYLILQLSHKTLILWMISVSLLLD